MESSLFFDPTQSPSISSICSSEQTQLVFSDQSILSSYLPEHAIARVIVNNDKITVVRFENVSSHFLVHVRKCLYMHVPVVAVDRVEIHENTSGMDDERIIDKLTKLQVAYNPSLLVNRTMENEFSFLRDPMNAIAETSFDDGSCDQTTLKFTLDVSCDLFSLESGKYKLTNADIYNSHITYTSGGRSSILPSISSPDSLLFQLNPGNRLRCTLYATKGTSEQHYRHQAIIRTWFTEEPVVTVRPELLNQDQQQRIQSVCPRDVFDIEDIGLVASRSQLCNRCHGCIEIGKEAIEILASGTYIFTIESGSVWRPLDALLYVLYLLQKNIQ